jgi:hypothetical protein
MLYRNLYHKTVLLFMAAAALAAAPALAGPSPSESTAVGAFVVACGGVGTGGQIHGGDALSGMFYIAGGSPSACNSQTSGNSGASLGTSISQHTSYLGNSFSDSAQALVSLKTIHLTATSTGPTDVEFPTGAAQGGFTTIPLTLGGQPSGTTGLAEFSVHVEGTLTEVGPDGRPGFWITPYLNGNVVGTNSIYNALNPVPVVGSGESVGYQTRIWFDPAPALPATTAILDVNETVTFAVPVVFGTPFTLGLYGVAMGSTGAFGAGTVDSTSTSNFIDTITWEGFDDVIVGGSPVSYSLASPGPINWATPAPEPGTLGLLTVGLAGVVALRRRRA